MKIGKDRRIRRIFYNNMQTLIVPLDHGITMGPIKGLNNIKNTVKDILENGADGIIIHKGLVKSVIGEIPPDKVLGIHLNAGTNLQRNSSKKGQICSIEDAIYWGADFVSYHLNIGTEMENVYFQEVEKIQRKCNKYGIPLMGMVYTENKSSVDNFYHSIRIAEELGFDMVKIWCPDDLKIIEHAVEQSNIPIFIAGGNEIEEQVFVEKAKKILEKNVAGLACGRNIFGARNRDKVIQNICLNKRKVLRKYEY